MFGLISEGKHHRTTVQIVDKLKTDFYNFYLRDDISYQLPAKKDTLIINHFTVVLFFRKTKVKFPRINLLSFRFYVMNHFQGNNI